MKNWCLLELFQIPNPHSIFFGLSFQVFRSSFPSSGYSMFPILILCWNFVSGLTVFVCLCFKYDIFGICFEACWLFVVSFCGVFSQECPKCSALKLCETKCWRCSQSLLVFVSRYLAWLFCYIICPKLSLLWRLCFVELFCWYELFMNLRPDIQ